MLEESLLLSLVQNNESSILEFKKEWYWDDNTDAVTKQKQWGELIKDLISIANGYMQFVGKKRYLIVGFCEKTKTFNDITNNKTKELLDIKSFQRDIKERLESFTNPSFTNLELHLQKIENKTILIFEVDSHTYLIELKKDLQTKTRSLDQGGVLVRRGQRSDEVRIANRIELNALTEEFSKYKDARILIESSKPKNDSDKPERSIEKTVQLFINKNSSYSIASGSPVKVRDWKENIIYEVYELKDQFNSIKEFIYIHENSVLGKTIGHIKQKQTVKNISNAIILTDRPKLKDVNKRKENIKNIAHSDFIYFVDEFGYQFLYKDCILPYVNFDLPIYIDSLYDFNEDTDLSALDRLKTWFTSENEPLFVVSGHGGIGKTTLAKQFLDFLHAENHNSGILFIDSKEIIGELLRAKDNHKKINDVYDFYQAQMQLTKNESSKFNRELLQLSIDNGSLIIVLDGIDEVIAKLGDKFDVDSFIFSIFNEYSTDLNRTKILITCRDHFWNEIGKKILLPEIKLKAFNHESTLDFFSQYLDSDTRKVEKALAIANKLAIEINSNNDRVYIPFLLDIIGYLIKYKNDDIDNIETFSSDFLNKDNNIDYLIAKVCNREIIKLESLNLDEQIKFFIQIATNKDSGINVYDIKNELLSIIESEFDNKLIEKIKGHPLLIFTENTIKFRYDVFNVYFKALFVADFFKKLDVSEFDERIQRIMSGYLKFDNSFTISVCEKLKFDDEILFFTIQLIELASEKNISEKEIFVSSLVSLLFTLTKHGTNLATRTELIEKLFSLTDNRISGLCMVDFFGSNSFKPIIDFRTRKFVDCYFDNYEYFWDCPMDDETHFDNSFFKNLDITSSSKPQIGNNLFSKSCNTSNIQHILEQTEEIKRNNKQQILEDLLKLFRLFYERGNFYPRKQEQVRSKVFAAKLLPDLISKGVVIDYKDSKKPTMSQYRISDKYKSVINYIEQGSQSAELSKLCSELAG